MPKQPLKLLTAPPIALLALILFAPAAARAFEPVFLPQLDAAPASAEFRIDGSLDEPGWRDAARTDRFVERRPGENVEPPVRTEAMLTYDQDNIYVAFVCDDDPAAVRATMCQRDLFDGDDCVGLLLDTFGDASWAYEFFVNPYGIQMDLMWTNVQGEDRGFDLVWHSAAALTETGYVVEMAIPLAGIRFPDRETQAWRIDFQRNHPRDSFRQYSWAAYDRNEQCMPCQWGTVTGIAGIRPGRGLEILPSYIGYQTGGIRDAGDPDSGIDDQDVRGEMSLGAKVSVSSDVTFEATLNPDFSQIEADADQIDVNTTIVQRFPERRPFFQEGNDLFRTPFNSFYTRMVSDPELAVKGTARWDRTSFAYMLARDEHSPYIIPTEERTYRPSVSLGRSTVNILRGLQSMGGNSQAGFMITDRRYDEGGSGTIFSADAIIRLSPSYNWVAQVVHSHTEEPEGVAISAGETFDDGAHTVDLDGESFNGTAFITELRRRTRHWNFTIDYNELTPDYRTQTGYDPWTDQKNSFVWTNYNFYPGSGIFERITPSLFGDGRWNYDGRRKWMHGSAAVNGRLRWAQTEIALDYDFGSETWFGTDFDDIWDVSLYVATRPSAMIRFTAFLRTGRSPAIFTQDEGDEDAVSLSLDFKPFDRLVIEPTFDYIRSDHAETGELLFKQTITRARIRYQVNPRLSVRLVVQHNDSVSPLYRELAQTGDFPYHMAFGRKWELDPLITYRINPFSVFYLGSTHDWRDFNAAFPDRSSLFRVTDRQFFTKIQYLFQI